LPELHPRRISISAEDNFFCFPDLRATRCRRSEITPVAGSRPALANSMFTDSLNLSSPAL
jgi:hypothetical protein